MRDGERSNVSNSNISSFLFGLTLWDSFFSNDASRNAWKFDELLNIKFIFSQNLEFYLVTIYCMKTRGYHSIAPCFLSAIFENFVVVAQK